MPQMSPMWWETLFLTFNILLIMINIIIFWNMKSKKASLKINVFKSENKWKW